MFCNMVFQQHLQPLCLLQFFEETPSACTHLTILSNQLSMTPDHVDWGMSKMMPSKNDRASSAFWNCFPFSCFLTGWNKNQAQGAKSGEYGGWVTSWTSLVARKSRVTAAVCTLALSWWNSRPWTPVRWHRLHHAWKTLGKQWLTYQPAVTVFCPQAVWWQRGPILQRNTLSFVWKHFCFYWISQVGSHLGRPTPPTVASYRSRIDIPRFHLLLRCPKSEETFLRRILLTCGYTSPPYAASALHSTYGVSKGHNFFLHQGSREEFEWDFPMKSSWCFVFQRTSFLGPS